MTATSQLASSGARVTPPDTGPGGRQALIADPTGNLIELFQPGAHPPRSGRRCSASRCSSSSNRSADWSPRNRPPGHRPPPVDAHRAQKGSTRS
jgi:hypothetical protein